jgi:HEPN domain-containing protein
MSSEKNRAEASRWLKTSLEDLTTARVLLKNGRFAHSTFHAQQAGEKALKAVWFFHGADPWGHSLRRLIEDLRSVSDSVFRSFEDLVEDGARLDRFSIPTRYPNGLPDITPDQAFFKEDAESAIAIAQTFIDRAEKLMKG